MLKFYWIYAIPDCPVFFVKIMVVSADMIGNIYILKLRAI